MCRVIPDFVSNLPCLVLPCLQEHNEMMAKKEQRHLEMHQLQKQKELVHLEAMFHKSMKRAKRSAREESDNEESDDEEREGLLEMANEYKTRRDEVRREIKEFGMVDLNSSDPNNESSNESLRQPSQSQPAQTNDDNTPPSQSP